MIMITMIIITMIMITMINTIEYNDDDDDDEWDDDESLMITTMNGMIMAWMIYDDNIPFQCTITNSLKLRTIGHRRHGDTPYYS